MELMRLELQCGECKKKCSPSQCFPPQLAPTLRQSPALLKCSGGLDVRLQCFNKRKFGRARNAQLGKSRMGSNRTRNP